MADGSAALDLSRNLLDDLFSHAHAALIGEDRGLHAGGGHGHKRKGAEAHGFKRKTLFLSAVGEAAARPFGDGSKRTPSAPSDTNGSSRGHAPRLTCVLPPAPPARAKETLLRVPLLTPPVSATCPPMPTRLAETPCLTAATCLAKSACLPTPTTPPRPHRPPPRPAAPSPRKILKRANAQKPLKPPPSTPAASPPPTTYLTSPPADLATPPAYMTSPTHPVAPDILTSYLTQFYARLTSSAATRLATRFSSLSSSLSSSPSPSSSSSSSSSSSFSPSFSAPTATDEERFSPKREVEEELEGKKACVVCGDHAPFLQPSAALVCDSCRAFFWRSVVDASYKDFACANSWGCMVTVSARRACQACRFFSCLRAGMDISRAKGEEEEESPGPSRSPHASPSCVTEATGAEGAASTSRGSSRTAGSLGPSEPPVSPHLRSSHSTIPLAAPHVRAGHHSSGPRAPGAGPHARVFVAPGGAQRSVITSSSSVQDPLSAPIKTEDSPSFKYPARSVIQSALGSASAPFRPPRSQERRRKPAPGAASSDPGEAASSGPSSSTATPPPVLNMKELESLLTPEDCTDLRELEESYHRAFENISVPMENRMIKPDELSKLYSFFIKRRANFLVSTALYSTLAPADRPKLLRIAVSMCTYITGAHLMDTRNYMWPKQGEALASPPTPMLSAATIRQYLSHEQFIRLMRFYVNYSSYYCDERIAIMMQVLSLAYPETGLADPAVVDEGRRRYGGLLSRYLLAVYGPEAGVSMFRALLSSQVEMRQLVEINQHVELVPRVSRQEDANAGAALSKGIQLVCDGAMEIIDQLMRRQGGLRENGLISELQQRARALAVVRPEGAAQVDDPEHLVVIRDVLRRLANCDDPKLLADARRIIPTDRLKQFHKMLE